MPGGARHLWAVGVRGWLLGQCLVVGAVGAPAHRQTACRVDRSSTPRSAGTKSQSKCVHKPNGVNSNTNHKQICLTGIHIRTMTLRSRRMLRTVVCCSSGFGEELEAPGCCESPAPDTCCISCATWPRMKAAFEGAAMFRMATIAGLQVSPGMSTLAQLLQSRCRTDAGSSTRNK